MHVLFPHKLGAPVLQVQDPLLLVLVDHAGVQLPCDRMGVSAAVDDRDFEATSWVCLWAEPGQSLGKLVDKDVLPAGVRQAGDHLPLVNAVVGDHQHMLPLGGLKGPCHVHAPAGDIGDL